MTKPGQKSKARARKVAQVAAALLDVSQKVHYQVCPVCLELGAPTTDAEEEALKALPLEQRPAWWTAGGALGWGT